MTDTDIEMADSAIEDAVEDEDELRRIRDSIAPFEGSDKTGQVGMLVERIDTYLRDIAAASA